MPSTPNISTSSVAWSILLFGLAIEALAFYIGLPRVPPPLPIRKRSVIAHQEPNNYGEILDYLSEKDVSSCLARFLCHVGATEPDQLTFLQQIILNFVALSGTSSPEWKYSNSSMRKPLVEAVEFGKTTKCTLCCQTMYPTCTLPIQQLMFLN
ncbi:hypothetical protein CHUAL_004831 [Chamberlinius hualienensis]